MTECISEPFLTRVKNDQKSLGIVARPGALPGNALNQRQAFLSRTAKAGDAGNHLDRQRQRADHVFVKTHGQAGINEIWIELENLAVMIYRSEEHTSELQSLRHLVCRLLLEKKKKKK